MFISCAIDVLGVAKPSCTSPFNCKVIVGVLKLFHSVKSLDDLYLAITQNDSVQ